MKIKVTQCTDERRYFNFIGGVFEVLREIPIGYVVELLMAGQSDKMVIVKEDAEIVDEQ